MRTYKLTHKHVFYVTWISGNNQYIIRKQWMKGRSKSMQDDYIFNIIFQ